MVVPIAWKIKHYRWKFVDFSDAAFVLDLTPLHPTLTCDQDLFHGEL
jgi:hypothetical protein